MQRAVLEGHYSQRLEVDVCGVCHLVWFDAMESVRLSGLGWVQLLRVMQTHASSRAVLPRRMGCVRCQNPLQGVRNLTRFGRTAALECTQGHGHAQTFSLLLAERGLLREVLPSDRQALAREGRSLQCLQCGAAQDDASAVACAYCESPLLVVDVPRLCSALLVRHADAVTWPADVEPLALACKGCGQALNPTSDTRCPHCDHGVTWSDWAAVRPLLDAVEPLLRGQCPRQARPWGKRLQEQKGDYRATQLYRWFKRWW